MVVAASVLVEPGSGLVTAGLVSELVHLLGLLAKLSEPDCWVPLSIGDLMCSPRPIRLGGVSTDFQVLVEVDRIHPAVVAHWLVFPGRMLG